MSKGAQQLSGTEPRIRDSPSLLCEPASAEGCAALQEVLGGFRFGCLRTEVFVFHQERQSWKKCRLTSDESVDPLGIL